ncbi:MAG: putative DNA-binding protein [Pelotomaculum sp. PtaB.Bin117]|nr:MAG: putative DNA-binding protein [Pelotomaculum sp. PtaB.Bin117]OPY57805.1 MAG: putative DNA-binding protein [Pelotomaculum sp. PtaU1.Bin065]
MLEKVAWMNLLYDFYGQLLTDRQKNFIELYYSQNLSLGEIAGEFEVTRQAVHDTLKRAGQLLEEYEVKLGLVEKFLAQREKLLEAGSLLDEYKSTGQAGKVLRAREILNEVLELTLSPD